MAILKVVGAGAMVSLLPRSIDDNPGWWPINQLLIAIETNPIAIGGL